MLVRYVNKVKEAAEKKEVEEAAAEPAPAGPSELDILIEIRDSLSKQ